MKPKPKRTWLILSYMTNMDGNACSQHIDDKLQALIDQGINPVLLSGSGMPQHTLIPHKKALSIAPSGLRYELRSFLRLHCKSKLTFKLFETPLLIPILPLYLLEKILLGLESEWSWFFRAGSKGIKLCKEYEPELIYSTGGPASAHIAADRIARKMGLPWIAELQDPIIHDAEYHRSKRAFRYYSRLEKRIRKNSCATLFMCDAARTNCNRRTGITDNSFTIFPGANKQSSNTTLVPQKKCIFNHFGSLGGSRDGTVFIEALQNIIEKHPEYLNRIEFNLYGTCDHLTEKSIANFPFKNTVTFHGRIARQEAIDKMNNSSCLLLIQNREFFSSETIPSKLYEYMHTGRPILALTYQNKEIDTLLLDGGHFTVAADKTEQIGEQIKQVVTLHESGALNTSWPPSPWTAKRAVTQLLSIADTCLE